MCSAENRVNFSSVEIIVSCWAATDDSNNYRRKQNIVIWTVHAYHLNIKSACLFGWFGSCRLNVLFNMCRGKRFRAVVSFFFSNSTLKKKSRSSAWFANVASNHIYRPWRPYRTASILGGIRRHRVFLRAVCCTFLFSQKSACFSSLIGTAEFPKILPRRSINFSRYRPRFFTFNISRFVTMRENAQRLHRECRSGGKYVILASFVSFFFA